MHRRFLHFLLVYGALAVALLAPLCARAAILPACENHELVTLATPPALSDRLADAPAEPAACATPSDEPSGDTKVAPICDPRGASAVAPPRVHPVSDAHIEAVPSCELQISSPMIGPAPRDRSPAYIGAALAEQATIATLPTVPPSLSELSPAYPPVRGEVRPGVERGVYHPPR
jgi:hypothetical protein